MLNSCVAIFFNYEKSLHAKPLYLTVFIELYTLRLLFLVVLMLFDFVVEKSIVFERWAFFGAYWTFWLAFSIFSERDDNAQVFD